MTKQKKWVTNFIYLLPIIDFITSICTWQNLSISIGTCLKGIFLIYATYYLLKHPKHKKIIYLLAIYLAIQGFYIILSAMSLKVEIENIIKIFYFPILILFFSNYEEKSITKKAMGILLLFYLILYLAPFFFGLGHNISEFYPNKLLYLSYFYSGNEIANVIIILLPTSLIYILESNSYLLKSFYAILLLFTILLLSTKTFYISLFVILIYMVYKKRKKIVPFLKKYYLQTLLGIAVILLGLNFYLPKINVIENFKTSLNHYKVETISNLFTLENIDNVIFSSRLTFLKNVNEAYKQSSVNEKIMGLGRQKINTLKNIEIDIFDIFYSIGILGLGVYLFVFCYTLRQSKIKGIYKFTFILLLVISCFTGHVLISPFTSTILALLFLVSKNENGKIKKDILLVTNMYPSKEYPHYGVFVQNAAELLQSKYTVDLVLMHKETKKWKKLIAYIKFYLKSAVRIIFNNYEFIYVHFISHSTRGIFVPYLCTKNTKLVLNPHGNDIVADYDFERKNESRSAKYLKKADRVIAPSKYYQEVLIKKYKVPKEKIVIYPSGGVNMTKFKKMEKKEAKRRAGLEENQKYFGYVSRIEKDKGYDTLLQAISLLKEEGILKNCKFLIIGNGAEEPRLNALIQEYQIQEYIERKPFATQNELVIIYNAIEALIYPTRRKSESLGLTGLEAMACETLVIGSNKYGPSDYLLNNKNSLTFNPEDAKELAQKIKEGLKMNESKKEKLTKEARKTSEEYSYEKTKMTLLQVFEKKTN